MKCSNPQHRHSQAHSHSQRQAHRPCDRWTPVVLIIEPKDPAEAPWVSCDGGASGAQLATAVIVSQWGLVTACRQAFAGAAKVNWMCWNKARRIEHNVTVPGIPGFDNKWRFCIRWGPFTLLCSFVSQKFHRKVFHVFTASLFPFKI